jgi:hypothetical protein
VRLVKIVTCTRIGNFVTATVKYLMKDLSHIIESNTRILTDPYVINNGFTTQLTSLCISPSSPYEILFVIPFLFCLLCGELVFLDRPHR